MELFIRVFGGVLLTVGAMAPTYIGGTAGSVVCGGAMAFAAILLRLRAE